MKNTYSKQGGFVSIVVCLIIMVILSMVTIGFTQLMGREQRQALDRQLSTQAFYAAESGVNDANLSLLKQGGVGFAANSCTASVVSLADASVKSACVSVDKTPGSLTFDNIGTNPKVIPIVGTNPLSEITISWSQVLPKPGATSDFTNTAPFVPYTEWATNTGIAKVYIMPFSNNDSRATIISNFAAGEFLPYAGGGGGSTTYASLTGSTFAKVSNGICVAAAKTCSMTVTSLPGYNNLYIAFSSLHVPSKFEITGKDSANAAVKFSDVQAVIDSTGKTTDVLRRIQVRKPLISDNYYPVGALQGDICKLWAAIPTPGITSNDPVCSGSGF